jgi:hypothetical protein
LRSPTATSAVSISCSAIASPRCSPSSAQ